jgi:hypothetical protein
MQIQATHLYAVQAAFLGPASTTAESLRVSDHCPATGMGR